MRLDIGTPTGPATVDLDRPPRAWALLVLTHGAGGSVMTPDVGAVRRLAAASGIAVALVTQPYRVAGRRSPPAAGPQDAAWVAVVDRIRHRRGLGTLPLVQGGRSNGARVGCRTAAAVGAAGVVCLAFPLHPPGRPDLSRLAELDAPAVPVLVLQGDRDPFGMPPAGPLRHVLVVAGAGHDLKRDTAGTATAVVEFVTRLAGRGTVEA